jgi:hypothetical protein
MVLGGRENLATPSQQQPKKQKRHVGVFARGAGPPLLFSFIKL